MGPSFRRDDGGGSSGPHRQIEMGGPLQCQPRLFQVALQCLVQENRSEPSAEAVCGRQSRRMPMQFRVSPKALGDYSAEEWQARVDLAAAHRLAFMQGFSEGVFNHLTPAVPAPSDPYYQIPSVHTSS